MSVLLVAPPPELGRAVVDRLMEQDDEVRVLDPDRSQTWKEVGAFVAHGSPDDADLVERAGQNARSIVLFDPSDEVMTACVEAARMARIERVIVVASGSGTGPTTITRESGNPDYVILIAKRRRWGRRDVTDQAIAVAVDAADDLSGKVRLELDLSKPGSWAELGLPAPG